jgi:hypothetical protein
MRVDIATISAGLARAMPALVPALGFPPPKDQRRGNRGHEWCVLNTVRGEKNAGSLWIVMDGPKAGQWIDFVSPEQLRGDALGLVAYAQTGDPKAWRPAAEWAQRWLGLAGDDADLKRAGLSREAAAARALRAEHEAQAAGRLEAERRRLKARWLRAEPLAPGQPAWTYLSRARGVPLDRLAAEGRLSGALRGEAEAFQRWRPDDPGPKGPTLITQLVMIDPETGATPFAGVHLTFLAADGGDKAAIDAAKRMRPQGIAGAAAPIAKGPGGRTIAQALAHWRETGEYEAWAICEGIEDALTLAAARPEFRVLAAGTLGNLGRVPVPACALDLVVLADNDASPEARRAFQLQAQALAARAHAIGGRLRVFRSAVGKDLNEQLLAKRGGGA